MTDNEPLLPNAIEAFVASRHAGADIDAMTAKFREGAKWTVEEGDTASPTVSLWRPFSRPDIESIRFGSSRALNAPRDGRASC